MKRYISLLSALAALLCAGSASAQKRTTQGFETKCDGSPFGTDSFNGYGDYPSGTLAACGISSAVTGESANMRIAGAKPLTGVPGGITGSRALAGAYNNQSPSNLTIQFAPAVNELSFQVAGISNNGNLRIQTFDASGNQLTSDTGGGVSNERIYYSKTSTTPIARLFVSYPQGGLLPITTQWFVDELSYNAWVCGDGELESQHNETCDDGNQAQCDGCTTTCTASVAGCASGSTCIAPGMLTACSVCDPSKPANANGDVPVTQQPMGTACDDAKKCTQNDACDGSGQCVGAVHSCDDAIACTTDACSESTAGDGCTHTVAAHACLIGTSCVNELAPNPGNPCQRCDPTLSVTSWSAQASTVRCGEPSCTNGQFTAAALCDGAGACTPATATSCGNFTCTSATSCTDTCSDDRECGIGSHCDTTSKKCVINQGVGTPCTSAAQCGNGLACADGVCCESACGSRCETCNALGFAGKCVNITYGDPERECPAGSSCRSGNQCVQDPPAVMPPTGVADAGMMSSPGNNGLPIGAACAANEACGPQGICRDGVCCDSVCDGPCQGCNVMGSTPGQCTAYSLGTDPENECEGVGGVCSGERACTFYETRGNGLCSPLPGQPGNAKYALTMVALVLALAWQRRRASSRSQGS